MSQQPTADEIAQRDRDVLFDGAASLADAIVRLRRLYEILIRSASNDGITPTLAAMTPALRAALRTFDETLLPAPPSGPEEN
ncbi:MAG TPA: hypothetical protein VIY73_12725 [Polyangiaceae bacterium]